ncbi:MAG: type II toxin-antitoxin system RelE/ParE family toxin [Proteobacteria bacterium]|nr:type II toxin-antitoxin system RelE/ParE family toxin [Pseudomonadota bacterium]
MTYKIRFAPAARQQLATIEDYIALASGYPAVAEQFVDDVVAYCESFETFPERGTQRDDLLPGLRTVGYRRRVTVAFRVDTASLVVTILGVFYGGQDFEAEIAPTGCGDG